MKQTYLTVFLGIAILSFGITENVAADLIDRGGGLIYDTELDVTWLQDSLSNCGQVVPCTWDNAMARAGNFVYYDTVRDVYWDDWRLPHGDSSINIGYNVGEMGHLYYDELGNIYQGGQAIFNPGPFVHLDYNSVFWTDTEYLPEVGLGAFVYDFWGYQHQYSKINTWRAWAVRDGDVASPVPEPTTMLLFGIGIAGLTGIKIRKRKQRPKGGAICSS